MFQNVVQQRASHLFIDGQTDVMQPGQQHFRVVLSQRPDGDQGLDLLLPVVEPTHSHQRNIVIHALGSSILSPCKLLHVDTIGAAVAY